MIIWGSKGKAKKINQGVFFCPNCKVQTQYIHFQMGKYFTLYFIPIFQTESFGEYVECQSCKSKFETSILDKKIDALFITLISDITKSLNNGLPVLFIIKQLVDSGVSEKYSKELVVLALGDSFSKCPSCESIFSSKITHCSLCGTKLSKEM
jgi:hypothetical protein